MTYIMICILGGHRSQYMSFGPFELNRLSLDNGHFGGGGGLNSWNFSSSHHVVNSLFVYGDTDTWLGGGTCDGGGGWLRGGAVLWQVQGFVERERDVGMRSLLSGG